jgi:gamma-glutamyltranspeptidase
MKVGRLCKNEWAIEAEDKKRKRAMSAPSLSSTYRLTIPEGRNTTAHIKSVDTGGNAVKSTKSLYWH